MKGIVPKLLIPIRGKPLIRRVVDACSIPEIELTHVVVGLNSAAVKRAAGPECRFVVQKRQLGTAHALAQVKNKLQNYRGDLVVSVGDSPFLTSGLIRQLIRRHRKSAAVATFLTTTYPEPPPYARVVRSLSGKILDVIEENKCMASQKKIKEVLTSHYCFRAEIVLPLLSEIRRDNPKREYYLTDIIPVLIRHRHKVRAVRVKNPRLVFGINDLRDLHWVTRKN